MALPLFPESEGETTSNSPTDEVRKKIKEGMDQARRGELLDGEEVFAELEFFSRYPCGVKKHPGFPLSRE